MSLHIQEFQHIAKSFDSVYEATMYVAKTARRYAEKTNNRVLHSEAIDWVLTGETPEILNQSHRRAISYIDDLLSEVSDSLVCRSVRCSVYESTRNKHLIYRYIDVNDEPRRARVRVLTNMIWYRTSNDF